MKKCAVIIETSKGKLIVPVENFSKENCINALAKVIKVDSDKIEQVSASANQGIYGLKEHFPSAAELFTQTVMFYSNEHFTHFIMDYGCFAE